MTTVIENDTVVADDEEIGMCELRQMAKAYYGPGGAGKGVTQKMEEVLNSMFYEKPADVFGHLANYFESFAKKPTIVQLRGHEVLDSRGQPTIQTQVYCEVKNTRKLTATFVSSSAATFDAMKQEEREEREASNQRDTDAAILLIEEKISELLQGIDPADQENVDTLIIKLFDKMREDEVERLAKEKEEESSMAVNQNHATSPETPTKPKPKPSQTSPKGKGGKGPATVIVPDEPPEMLMCGCDAAAAVSQAICKSAALVADLQLYEYIARCAGKETCGGFRLPLPMVTLMSGGRGSPGKLRSIKEFMLVPAPGMSLATTFKSLQKIYSFCSKAQSTSKTGALLRMTTDTGTLCPLFDRPEQGLDLLQEAITSAGLTPGVDFHLAINCAAHETFDFDKGKYEVSSGQLKTSEELMKYWIDLLARYPSIIAIIDPMRKQDGELWMQLAEAVSPHCYIVGDFVYHRPGRLRNEDLIEEFKTSAMILYLQQLSTVSDVIACARKMEEAGNQIIIGCGPSETVDSFASDLAVGCRAKFIKIGGLCRGERAIKLHRLLEIESHLVLKGHSLDGSEEHIFTTIALPPRPSPAPANTAEVTSPSATDLEKQSAKKQK